MAKLLIVDDEPSLLKVLSDLTRSAGHEPVTASRGDTAIRLFTDEHFDLLITNLRMSPVDGMQVLDAARTARPTMPTIVLTASGSAERREEAKALGAFAFLAKTIPFDIRNLFDTIARALETAQDTA